MIAISLINMKGGVGKTTLSVNISDCLARRHKSKVLLIDIDPQFNATQCIFSGDEYVNHIKKGKDTILNIFDSNFRPIISSVEGVKTSKVKKLDQIKVTKVKNNFYILPGNLELFRIEMSPGSGRENRLNKFISKINEKEDFDYVIIDTPPTPSIWMTSALLASDYYLIPVKPDPISFTGIDLLQGIINDKKENLDLEIECAGVVLTIVEDQTLVYKQAVKHLDQNIWAKYRYKKELPKRTAIAREQLSKTFILDINDAVSKAAIAGIVEELVERVN